MIPAGDLPAPGSWKSALFRDDAPGAPLDSQPWARSWGAYMRAITDPMDSSARQYIANVTEVANARFANAGFSERLPAGGGFLVPENLRSQVVAYMAGAIVRPAAMVLPMTSLRLRVPFLDNPSQQNSTGALGGLTFAWTEESAGITPSAPTFGNTTLQARKAAGYLQGVPNELVDDGSGAIGDFLGRVTTLGYEWFEDDAFFNGTGTGEPQGLINVPCQVPITRTNSAAAPVLLDFINMFKALHPASKRAGMKPGVTSVCWLVSDSVMDAILELYYNPSAGSNTGIVAATDWFQAGDGYDVGPSILGLPCQVTDHQPASGTTGDVMIADLRFYAIGDRMTMTVERAAKGAGFADDASDFRLRSRLDGRYLIQGEGTTSAGTSVSPVVVLH